MTDLDERPRGPESREPRDRLFGSRRGHRAGAFQGVPPKGATARSVSSTTLEGWLSGRRQPALNRSDGRGVPDQAPRRSRGFESLSLRLFRARLAIVSRNAGSAGLPNSVSGVALAGRKVRWLGLGYRVMVAWTFLSPCRGSPPVTVPKTRGFARKHADLRGNTRICAEVSRAGRGRSFRLAETGPRLQSGGSVTTIYLGFQGSSGQPGLYGQPSPFMGRPAFLGKAHRLSSVALPHKRPGRSNCVVTRVARLRSLFYRYREVLLVLCP